MEDISHFIFDQKERNAIIFQSIDTEGGYIFCILKDKELVERFGVDIDFQTDGEKVIINRTVINQELYELQTAILASLKQTSSFQGKVHLLEGRRTA
jgi:hypothetical protein